MALYLRKKDILNVNTQAYLYKWTHIPTKKWYVGSRTTAGSHPADGYICSSKIVKPLIIKNLSEWSREVLAIGTPDYILDLETKYLISTDAKNDIMSFNRHNGNGKFTSTGIKASDATRKKMSLARIGVPKSEAHCNAIKISLHNSEYIKSRKGEKTSRFVGYYVSPSKEKFDSAWEASKKYGPASTTIRRWAKNNKNGWSFIPKGVKA
jgi:hypothetical protein